jgi:hypothetical protein
VADKPNVHVASFADEERFTVRYFWDTRTNHWTRTFTNMNDKVVQLDFSNEQWHRIVDDMAQR